MIDKVNQMKRLAEEQTAIDKAFYFATYNKGLDALLNKLMGINNRIINLSDSTDELYDIIFYGTHYNKKEEAVPVMQKEMADTEDNRRMYDTMFRMFTVITNKLNNIEEKFDNIKGRL